MREARARKARSDAETGERDHPSALDGPATHRGPLGGPATSAAGVVALQRAAGNRAVSAAVGPARAPVQRQTPTPGSGPMTRSRFVELMTSRYAITTVRAGTFADQQEVNRRPGVAAGGELPESAWAAWDPGESSEIYQSIVTGFEDFESAIGGVPPVAEVLFFATAYGVEPATGRVVPAPGTGADFGAGHLRVYRAGVAGGAAGRKGIPIGRSTESGPYPPVVAGLGGTGNDPGAPIPLPTAGENTVRVITHELGHGLAEQAMAADPAMFDQYRLAVGWTDGRLFDVGIPEVRRALDAGAVPPATVRHQRGGRVTVQPTQITVESWNHPRWVEQPISAYTVTGGPGEDFAEAVMAYINSRAVLVARSPVRSNFLESHRGSWLPFLRSRPPIGDFPAPAGAGRLA